MWILFNKTVEMFCHRLICVYCVHLLCGTTLFIPFVCAFTHPCGVVHCCINLSIEISIINLNENNGGRFFLCMALVPHGIDDDQTKKQLQIFSENSIYCNATDNVKWQERRMERDYCKYAKIISNFTIIISRQQIHCTIHGVCIALTPLFRILACDFTLDRVDFRISPFLSTNFDSPQTRLIIAQYTLAIVYACTPIIMQFLTQRCYRLKRKRKSMASGYLAPN